MFWELIATASAGLGAAGIALIARQLMKQIPKALIPAAAGLGMLAFQIHQEYQWFDHIRDRLPAGSRIVAEVRESAWYKPWSYLFPPTLRFAVIDPAQNHPWQRHEHIRHTLLYFFERRMPAQHWPILIDCASGKQADVPPQGQTPAWQATAYSASIARILCP